MEEALEAVLKVKVKYSVLIKAMEGTTPQRIRKQSIDFSVAEAFSHEEKFIALQTQLFSLFRYFLEL